MKSSLSSGRRFIALVVGILGLSLCIIVHELGHFLTSKLFGVTAPVFSIGFGPVIFARTIANTSFQLALLPLGGFVAIDPAAFAAQPYWQQAIILLAGVASNMILAFLISIFLARKITAHLTTTIDTIAPESPADQAGLQPADTIVAVNATPVHHQPQPLINAIINSPSVPLSLTIIRDGQEHTLTVTPSEQHPMLGSDKGWLGATFVAKQGKARGVWESIQTGASFISNIIKSVESLFTSRPKPPENQPANTKTQASGDVLGPIGIITLTGRSVQQGLAPFLLVLALLNINIAILNLLPIPLFDGGKLAVRTLELFTGPLPPLFLQFIDTITFMALLFLIAIITMRDVGRLRRKS